VFDIFGGDPLPCGLTPVNRRVGGYVQVQSFIDALLDIDAMFTLREGNALD
jgi:hypothetical protein